MDVTECALPDTMKPTSFPAKLWRLVNNPVYTAICWDSDGEGILINKPLFERQILSPFFIIPDNADAFKTTNFSSFVRQLNLYGFRKVELLDGGNQLCRMAGMEIHRFFNPSFKRSHPELIGGMRRLTANYKAKMEAGADISSQPSSKRLRFSGPDADEKRKVNEEKLAHGNPSIQETAHPPSPKKAQPRTAHFGTPVPPRYLIRGHGAVLSPVFSSDKGTQVTFNTQYAGDASSSSAMLAQPGLLAPDNYERVQYQQGYFPPGFQCYQVKQTSQIPLSVLPAGPFPSYGLYQASHTFNMFCDGNHSQGLPGKGRQEMKKEDIDLDTVFQIANDVMQSPLAGGVVKVTIPEKPQPVRACTPHTCSPSSVQETPPPIITAVLGNADQVDFKPPEISLVPVPEQLPEDAVSQQPS